MDDDGSGTVTLEEVTEYFEDPRVQSYFQALGVDPNDTERLFKLIDDDDSGDVSVDEFLEGCLRLKGQARGIDVHHVIAELKKLESKTAEISSIVHHWTPLTDATHPAFESTSSMDSGGSPGKKKKKKGSGDLPVATGGDQK